MPKPISRASREAEKILLDPSLVNLSYRDIAVRLKISDSTVEAARVRLIRSGINLPERPGSKRSVGFRRAEVMAFLETPEALDLSETEIGEKFGLSRYVVTRCWGSLFAARDKLQRQVIAKGKVT